MNLLFDTTFVYCMSTMIVSYCSSMILNTIKEGKIVPSEVTVKLIKKAIEASKNDRILVDGFPRSEENRIAYERVVSSNSFSFQLLLVI